MQFVCLWLLLQFVHDNFLFHKLLNAFPFLLPQSFATFRISKATVLFKRHFHLIISNCFLFLTINCIFYPLDHLSTSPARPAHLAVSCYQSKTETAFTNAKNVSRHSQRPLAVFRFRCDRQALDTFATASKRSSRQLGCAFQDQ